ncbi:S8 family serine peptidase [Actinokineospora soli]|uniref:S8 family serine peptidase n=1 Tax=Actinokineospora soli TaxID=1048753 RepID=A0ABW2TP67_9PSEU
MGADRWRRGRRRARLGLHRAVPDLRPARARPRRGHPELEGLVIVSAAGNDGAGGATTVGAPWEAKNPIVVGNSRNFRPGEGGAVDDIRGISDSSGRGPAVDGRILPTIVAPGSDIISARSTVDANAGMAGVQRPRTAYTDTGATVHQDYTRMSGTSMATPHVAGLCALLIEWWRGRTGGRTPSHALLKAFLVNGAEDLVGGPDGAGGTLGNVPSPVQGWGRVSLENMVLQAPGSDRGPRVFSDQRHAFTASGQEFTLRVAVADPARPLRVTMVYSDAPGAAGANPALVNNLNLEVQEIGSGTLFRGNVFTNGFSVSGGAFDAIDNVECVYVQNPTGVYDVRVIATSVVANARPPFDLTPWQDFALVIENAEAADADPAKVAVVLDRSGSMVSFGYVDVTRQASKQFIDLLRTDDKIGVASFGDSGDVEFPTAAPLEVQTVVGAATRTAARDEVDGIAFAGCTFMGAGIERGADLLAAETGPRSIVLFSDGYDNKGCQPNNPARPSALDAAGALPAEVRVHACAMGPASDQALLQALASTTSGRYYFMPTIDDLFEIYNFVRGTATSDGIIVNDTTTASASRVAGFVESLAERATFTCAWRNTALRFTTREPKRGQITVRLRDPRGKLLRPDTSFVRTTVGTGYVVFDLPDPAPGLWHVEVETSRDSHTRYTVGGFVDSPIRVRTKISDRIRPGDPISLSADADKPVTRLSGTAIVTAPVMGLPTLRTKFEQELRDIDPVRFPEDAPPDDIPRLLALHAHLLEKKIDIFERRSRRLGLTALPGSPSPATSRRRTRRAATASASTWRASRAAPSSSARNSSRST